MTGYKITASSTAPAAGDAGWTATAPTTYTVASAGTYTLYPWAKDAEDHVSAVFGSPRTVVVTTTISDILVMNGGAWNKYDFTTGGYLGGVWTGTAAGCTPALIDYDGDGIKEYSQLCGGAWHFYNKDGSYNKGIWVGNFPGSVPVPGDYNGDGVDEPVLFYAGAWHFFDFATGAYDAAYSKWTGTAPGCVPAPLDYNGDGKMEFSLFCGGPWHFYNSDGSYNKGIWIGGSTSNLPAPADYDGNGTEEVVLFCERSLALLRLRHRRIQCRQEHLHRPAGCLRPNQHRSTTTRMARSTSCSMPTAPGISTMPMVRSTNPSPPARLPPRCR